MDDTDRGKRARSPLVERLLALTLTVCILHFGEPVIVPLALAALFTFVLTPLVAWFQKFRLPRVAAVLVVVSVALCLASVTAYVVGLQVSGLARDLPEHTAEIKAKIAGIKKESGDGVLGHLSQMIRDLREPLKKTEPHPLASNATGTQASAGTQATPPVVSPAPGGPLGPGSTLGPDAEKVTVVPATTEEATPLVQLVAIARASLEPIADVLLVVVLVIFMLIKREDLRNRALSVLGHGHITGTTRVLVETAHRLSRFLLMQLAVNVVFGLVFGGVLLALDVPFAFLWGFLTAILRFVPYVGSWLAAALPITLSFAVAPDLKQPIEVFVSFAVLDLLTANVAEPLLFGHSTGVSPLALLIAAAFWTWVWGPIGLVLSTPLTLCLVVMAQHVPPLRFLWLVLGDQPPLEPRVQFYQRLLAKDLNEAKQIARDFGRKNGVDHVPDGVFVPALRLARRDREQSGLTAETEALLYDETLEVLGSLASAGPLPGPAPAATTPAAPEPMASLAPEPAEKIDGTASTPAALIAQSTVQSAQTSSQPVVALPPAPLKILGCPAHHRAEEVTLRMLERILDPKDYQLEVVSTRSLPLEIEQQIERDQPALVFLAVLPPGGAVQASYLCKRLKARFPELKIVVGYWGVVKNFDALLVRLRTAGARSVVTSLLQSRSTIQALLKDEERLTPAIQTELPFRESA